MYTVLILKPRTVESLRMEKEALRNEVEEKGFEVCLKVEGILLLL